MYHRLVRGEAVGGASWQRPADNTARRVSEGMMKWEQGGSFADGEQSLRSDDGVE